MLTAPWRPLLAAVFALVVIVICSGCSDKNQLESNWQTYITRLSRVLDRSPASKALDSQASFPRQRGLTMSFTAININLVEFLSMRHCALRETISQRNSILGKHGDASARLIFDLRFLNQAQDCIHQLTDEGNHKLALELQQAVKIKTRELPARLFSASIGGPEFRELWQPPPSLDHYPTKGDDPSIIALARWSQWQHQWLNGNWQHDSDAILSTLGEIRLGGGGSLLKAQRLAVTKLHDASSIINQRISIRPLCLTGSPTPAAKQFQNVLLSQFIAKIQQQASLINHHQYALMSQVESIEDELLSAMRKHELHTPPSYISWQHERKTLLKEAMLAHRQHVEIAGELLSQCGLSPAD